MVSSGDRLRTRSRSCPYRLERSVLGNTGRDPGPDRAGPIDVIGIGVHTNNGDGTWAEMLVDNLYINGNSPALETESVTLDSFKALYR